MVLIDTYGLDIRKMNKAHDGIYILVGEWFGSKYVSYV